MNNFFKYLNFDYKSRYGGYIYSVAITPNGRELVAAVKNFVKVWDLSSTKEILSLKGPQLDINKIAVSPDNLNSLLFLTFSHRLNYL